jgi:hypothetical protein
LNLSSFLSSSLKQKVSLSRSLFCHPVGYLSTRGISRMGCPPFAVCSDCTYLCSLPTGGTEGSDSNAAEQLPHLRGSKAALSGVPAPPEHSSPALLERLNLPDRLVEHSDQPQDTQAKWPGQDSPCNLRMAQRQRLRRRPGDCAVTNYLLIRRCCRGENLFVPRG